MKAWLIWGSFIGFVVLWMTGRIQSGWALLIFGLCYAGVVGYMFFGGSMGPKPDEWRRRR